MGQMQRQSGGKRRKRQWIVLTTSLTLRYAILTLVYTPYVSSSHAQDAGLLLGDIMMFPGEEQTRVSQFC